MELRRCVLALGAADAVTLERLRTALSGPGPTSASTSPGAEADPFASLPRELWLPAGAGQPPQGFAPSWVYLPAGGTPAPDDLLTHTVFDLALLAAPADSAGVAACRRLARMARCLGVHCGVVVWIGSETGKTGYTPQPDPTRAAPPEEEFPSLLRVWIDPSRPDSAEALRPALAHALAALPPERPRGRPRFWIEQAGDLNGPVSTFRGLLTDGDLCAGQTLVHLPAGRRGRVKALAAPEGEVARAAPGQRLSLTLEWLESTDTGSAAPGPSPPRSARAEAAGSSTISAGAMPNLVLVAPPWGELSDTLDVLLTDPDAEPGGNPARPWKDRERIRVCLGNAAASGTLFLHVDRADVPAGRLAQLRLDQPLPALGGDRLLVLAEGNSGRFAGARVLDPQGDRKRWQRPAQRVLLAARAAAPEDLPVWLNSQLRRDRLIERGALLARTLFPPAAVAAAVETAVRAGQIMGAGEWLAEAAWWADWQRRAGEAVDRFHAAQPHRLGLPLDQLRKAWLAEGLPPEGFEAMLHHLSRAGLVVSGTVVHREGRRPVLIERLAGAVARMRQQLTEQPLAPPARSVLTRDGASAEALQFLLESGEAVEVGTNLVLDAGAYTRAVGAIKEHLRRHGRATLSELREQLGTTRRVLIPLCEKLEREGITRREGDYHRLAGPGRSGGPPRRRTRAGR